jgi:hypothetical protein
MIIDRRLLAGAIGVSLILAACGGSSTATPAPAAATAAPATTATVTAEPTEAPAVTDAPTGSSIPVGQLNGLAALLPEEAAGVTFERVGYDGDQLGIFGAAAGLDSGELEPILTANGKTINDVNFAIATSADGSAGMIYAIQIEGVEAETFAAAMGMDTTSMPKSSLGGKEVYGEAAGGFGAFAYPKDDILFIVLLANEEVAISIFEQLP